MCVWHDTKNGEGSRGSGGEGGTASQIDGNFLQSTDATVGDDFSRNDGTFF